VDHSQLHRKVIIFSLLIHSFLTVLAPVPGAGPNRPRKLPIQATCRRAIYPFPEHLRVRVKTLLPLNLLLARTPLILQGLIQRLRIHTLRPPLAPTS